MKLSKYKQLITTLPVRQQAFTSNISTWEKALGGNRIPKELIDLFSGNKSVKMSRKDIFDITKETPQNILKVIYSTILWGYPNGMRNKYFSGIVKDINNITALLSDQDIQDWEKHIREIKDINGLGLSTYSKFLYFLNMRIENYRSLILDIRIIKVFKNKIFDEFENLSDIRYDNARKKYVDYLRIMKKEARKLSVDSENLEIFLFMFGNNLKK